MTTLRSAQGPPLSPETAELVARLGIEPAYWDTRGVRRHATTEAVGAVLTASGVETGAGLGTRELQAELDRRSARLVEPVLVAWDGAAPTIRTRSQGALRCRIELEDGSEHVWDVPPGSDGTAQGGAGPTTGPPPLPTGYHLIEVEVEAGAEREVAHLLSAPTRVAQPGAHDRTWGVLAPLYSLRGPSAGNLGALDALGEAVGAYGARVVATLPLLATFVDEPFDPSPYSPVSRRFWSELWLDPARLSALVDAGSGAGGGRPASPETARAGTSEPPGTAGPPGTAEPPGAHRDRFDYRARAAEVHRFLAEATRRFLDAAGSSRADYRSFLAKHPEVDRYARFRGAMARNRRGWHSWPAEQRDGDVRDGDIDPFVADMHRLAQFALDRQMTELRDGLERRGQRLYLDLPVGASGDGFDTWSEPDLFAWGCAVGAPPDDFFTEGQNWGFPPIVPEVGRAGGHAHLRACLRHHMSAAGVLRLDHVMQLHRLYWVPDGAHASEGVYVRYPHEELFAVVAIESQRSGCVVVGEDLGTVPDEVRDSLARHGMLGMYVSQFRLPGPHDPTPSPSPGTVASIATHDTPTFAGFVLGDDLHRRRDEGLLDDDGLSAELAARANGLAALAGLLEAEGHLPGGLDLSVGSAGLGEDGMRVLLAAILRQLGHSPADMVLVSFEDLLLDREPHNVPGTGVDRPNWVRRLPAPVEDLLAQPEMSGMLELLQGCRLAAWVEAAGTDGRG